MPLKQYKIDVNIVDDHVMFTESVSEMLNQVETIRVSRTFYTLESCRQSLHERRPDVLLLDISMPDGSGIDFCEEVIKDYPKMKIVAVTAYNEFSIIKRMLDNGAHGYLLKRSTIAELVNAVQCVWQGERYISPEVQSIISESEQHTVSLTNVERNILQLLCEGYTNPEVAVRMHLSTETVNWYRKRLLAKYDVRNIVGLVSLVMKKKII